MVGDEFREMDGARTKTLDSVGSELHENSVGSGKNLDFILKAMGNCGWVLRSVT